MFFEDPALLFGAPLLLFGALGALGALGAMFAPQPAAGGAVAHAGHPGEAEYVKVGLVLAAITAFEVLIYYVDMPRAAFVMVLLVCSLAKFIAVATWFMHLKFDSRLFTAAFVTGLLLATAIFTVVLVTLGGSLV
jgi:cytochrome c oxidase subunit 4